jgi:hypothetical protein
MIKFLFVSFLTIIVSSYAGRALAEDPKQPSSSKTPTTQSSKQSEKFVDKDGDGISDGKEHRFRKRGARHSGGNDGRQMKQLRNQNRNGQGNGSQGR